MDLFAFNNPGCRHEVGVESDRSNVVQVGLCDGGAMNLPSKDRPLQSDSSVN
ncbi:hypothetical protein MMMB2_1605 [Mycobacterium marinum MB2]|nr:hypothetical protein MMMB2_1605 [Mycobacterium marinum MB2]EPQ80855.1 hypothetical protein MMEU_1380 [Mycobacterium marinum str. Europe]